MTGYDPVQDCFECDLQDICEVFEKAKEDPNAPGLLQEAHRPSAEDEPTRQFASYNIRAQFGKERLRN